MQIQNGQLFAPSLRTLHVDSSPVAVPAVADPAHIVQFQNQMRPQESRMSSTLTPPPASGLQRPLGIGDSILQGLEKVRGALRQNWDAATELIGPPAQGVSIGSVLQFQVRMLDAGFQYQMVGSVVSKTAQNIDQLVKMQ